MKVEESQSLEELYAEAHEHVVNTGDEKIHAKRMRGLFRNVKWLSSSVWLIFFLGPYLRWGDRQAILFDIPNRQFHILNINTSRTDRNTLITIDTVTLVFKLRFALDDTTTLFPPWHIIGWDN